MLSYWLIIKTDYFVTQAHSNMLITNVVNQVLFANSNKLITETDFSRRATINSAITVD